MHGHWKGKAEHSGSWEKMTRSKAQSKERALDDIPPLYPPHDQLSARKTPSNGCTAGAYAVPHDLQVSSEHDSSILTLRDTPAYKRIISKG